MITRMQLNAFLDHAIAPVLDDLSRFKPALDGLAQRQLLLLTVVAESGAYFPAVTQEGGGPAKGPFQMEPTTHDDIWNRWLNPRHPELAGFIGRQIWCGSSATYAPTVSTMAWNHRYATAMARMQYWRRPEAHPPFDDAAAMAAYYKEFYNTAGGAADAAAVEILFNVHVAPIFAPASA